jgi:hypothetical protein
MQTVEREILAVFAREWVITPDEVRGTSSSLAAAIAERGWPTLGAVRGRVLFYLDNDGELRDRYTHNRRDLAGRLIFVDSAMTDPFAAVMVRNDPVRDSDAIRAALAAGYIVRTRADDDPAVARTNDRTRLTAALASRAHIVTTDFPAPVAGSAYSVEIPGGTPSRCSPVTAPAGCTPDAIESPAHLAR